MSRSQENKEQTRSHNATEPTAREYAELDYVDDLKSSILLRLEQSEERNIRQLQSFENALHNTERKRKDKEMDLLNSVSKNIGYLEGKVQNNVDRLEKYLEDLPSLEAKKSKLGVYAMMYQELLIANQTFTMVMGALNRERLIWDQLTARTKQDLEEQDQEY